MNKYNVQETNIRQIKAELNRTNRQANSFRQGLDKKGQGIIQKTPFYCINKFYISKAGKKFKMQT